MALIGYEGFDWTSSGSVNTDLTLTPFTTGLGGSTGGIWTASGAGGYKIAGQLGGYALKIQNGQNATITFGASYAHAHRRLPPASDELDRAAGYPSALPTPATCAAVCCPKRRWQIDCLARHQRNDPGDEHDHAYRVRLSYIEIQHDIEPNRRGV